MKLSNSQIINWSHKHCSTDMGELYFFKNFLVIEWNEGVIIDHKSYNEAKHLVYHYYGNKPFGFIANRINSYSINLSNATKFNEDFPNLVAYAIISYTDICDKICEIEDHFLEYNRKVFKNIEEGLNWVQQVLSINNYLKKSI